MIRLTLAVLCLALAMPAQAQNASPPVTVGQVDIDRLAKTLLDRLLANDAKGAVAVFGAQSSLMAGKQAELSQLEGQVQTSLTVYGPISAFELVEAKAYGSSAVRRRYVARHEKMVTRWELVFAQTTKGWQISYFGFEDQQRGWFVD